MALLKWLLCESTFLGYLSPPLFLAFQVSSVRSENVPYFSWNFVLLFYLAYVAALSYHCVSLFQYFIFLKKKDLLLKIPAENVKRKTTNLLWESLAAEKVTFPNNCALGPVCTVLPQGGPCCAKEELPLLRNHGPVLSRMSMSQTPACQISV